MVEATSPFALTLLAWFRENGRQLPWRETRDPYAIWLSEIILQQTQVRQGLGYWQRFMARFPNVEQLAQASEDEVLRLWQGLGYYSRARNLHAAARQIVAIGHFPEAYADILALKGVGPYTAAAIASIAFNQPVAVVDGNVYRVLSRHFGISTPINTTRGQHEFAELAQALLPPQAAATYNQALMDFGAIQCTVKSPRCQACPLQSTCTALHQGTTSSLPVKERRLKVRERHLAYVYIRCQGHTAIHRRGPHDIWQGLYEPLLIEPAPSPASSPVLGEGLGAGILLRPHVRHVLTHQVLTADFYFLDTDCRPTLPDDYFWIPETELDRYAVPRLVELLLELLP